MKRMIKFGSIGRLENTIRDIQHQARLAGFDETEKPIYNMAALPIITAVATEKIHGTNAAVCYSNPDGFWVQSKNNIITLDKDNHSCAKEALEREQAWISLIKVLALDYEIDLNENIITLYFEWAGGVIQTKSALTGMGKQAILFKHFKVSPIEPVIGKDGKEVAAFWLETSVLPNNQPKIWIDNPSANIYNIHNFSTWEIEIDFNQPGIANNKLIELVEDIEKNSPVGQKFGKSENIGEGIVVTFLYMSVLHKFKVKGDKHSNSKVKTLSPVDNEKEQAKINVASKVTPAWRLEQMYKETFGEQRGDIKRTGEFLKAVNKDIIKEELITFEESGFDKKEIFPHIQKISRRWFMEQLNREVGI